MGRMGLVAAATAVPHPTPQLMVTVLLPIPPHSCRCWICMLVLASSPWRLSRQVHRLRWAAVLRGGAAVRVQGRQQGIGHRGAGCRA